MTVVAVIAACNVRGVLSACRNAIVTGSATSQHLRVVDGHDWLPHIGGVAVFAHIGRLNMRRALAGGLRAIVAPHAVSGDAHVVEIRR